MFSRQLKHGGYLCAGLISMLASAAIAIEAAADANPTSMRLEDLQRLLDAGDFKPSCASFTDPKCGLYSLAFALCAIGEEHPISTLNNRINFTERGCTIFDLRDAANDLGVNAAVVFGSPDGFAELALPAILHLTESNHNPTNHFVVLTEVGQQHIKAYDWTIGGITTFDRADLAAKSSGYCLVFNLPAWTFLNLSLWPFATGTLIFAEVVWICRAIKQSRRRVVISP